MARRVICVALIVCFLLSVSASATSRSPEDARYEIRLKSDSVQTDAIPHEDDEYVINTVFYYYGSMAKIPFSDVVSRLNELGYTYTSEIGEDTLATIHVDCPEGSIYFYFYPLDISEKSTDFGNPDKEMLSCVEYKRGEKWITVSDGMHIKPTELTVGDKDDDPVNRTMSEIDSLRMFYNYKIGGCIDEFIDDSNIESQSFRIYSIRSTVEKRIKEYSNTSVTDITANQDISTTDPDDFILQVHLKWGESDSKDATKKMIEMYGDDLSVILSQKYENAKTILIYWEVPHMLKKGPVAKYEYENAGDVTYVIGRTGPLYYY